MKELDAQLGNLFGGYRAEWLGESLFELFTAPTYFPELMTPRPCVLMGGRGTGKTTILRCLSYVGQFALNGQKADSVQSWEFYGMYYRVNTNRMSAFKGPELDARGWQRHFAHYINLELCDSTLQFLAWHQMHCPDAPTLGQDACNAVAASLNLGLVDSLRALSDGVADARLRFEATINNIGDEKGAPGLSMQGAPIDLLFSHISRLPHFRDRKFFFLVDEYENFEDYQQEVVNTLIKHSSGAYTFKIGVRELGFRRRTTLNNNEQLISPSDYVLINIVDKLEGRFPRFAADVCNARLERLHVADPKVIRSVEDLFSELTEDDEAHLLGVSSRTGELMDVLRQEGATSAELAAFEALPPMLGHFLNFWAIGKQTPTLTALRDYMHAPGPWSQRLENYKYAALFTIRRKKRGIRKYYAGWSVFARLAAGNIRYLLELIDTALLAHLRDGNSLSRPIDPKTQTESAATVGRKNLTELEGLSIHGARLTKMLLGLGRIFQVMAAKPEGHTPEANQFEVRDDADDVGMMKAAEVDDLLRGAVMHLALLRFTGTKPQDESNTKAYDYMVHPIFAPLFEFSYRRKRKISLSAEDVLDVVTNPNQAIGRVLEQQHRDMTDAPIPEQLRLFEGFYAGGA
ncbi:ORC-CDC6 family AAA ATPase [Corallococcus llansteffanensis]|nr:hypothetical protein [Corallococcus llansteffanensis]